MLRTKRLGQGEDRPRIAVVGCGGAGCNTLHHLPPSPGLERIALNDVPHPSLAGIKHRLLLPEEELEAVATLNDSVARAIETDVEKQIARELIGFDMVVVIAGLGGDTGGFGANTVSRVAKLHNIATWAIVTLPFSAEGLRRRQTSQESLEKLRTRCPAILTFANDQLLKLVPDIPITKAFAVMGQIMVKPIESLEKVLTKDDVRTLRIFLSGADELRLGIGEGVGPHRSFIGVEEALSSPWLGFDVERARQALVVISGEELNEPLINEVLHNVNLKLPFAEVLWGSHAASDSEKIRICVLIPPC